MKRKVVLVTGSSRGIGKAIAIKFASNNYDVVINYNNSEKEAFDLKQKIENDYNIDALVIKADVSKEDDVKIMFEKIIKKYGRLDCLVNNAGIAIDKPFLDKTVDDFKSILDTNLIGVFLASKYAYNYLINQKGSSIINISSTNGIDTLYTESMDYDASKAGVISLTKNLATAYAPVVRVNSIAPGWVMTDMNKELEEEFIKDETDKILLKRFANPDEIANVVYFLATNEASYINGQVIKVDGGSY